jgi:hypothetical protein
MFDLIRLGNLVAALRTVPVALALVVMAGTPGRSEEACRFSPAERKHLLPQTQAPQNLQPLAAEGQALPDDCGFYKWAWEAFLYTTRPENGKIALLSMPTFKDVFKTKESPLFANQEPNLLSLAPRVSKVANKDEESHFEMRDMLQAGSQQALIDQKGNIVWYAIHLNKTYEAFIDDYGLGDRKALDKVPRDLAFRTGSLELKSAWQIVDGAPPRNYITTRAVVPIFRTLPSGEIVKDGAKTRIVTVALLGIHVVGTIEGHPEFIWSTFEHVSHQQKAWARDVAPAAKQNADGAKPIMIEKKVAAYALYPSDAPPALAAPVTGANHGGGIGSLKLDARHQTFAPKTSIYRQFPGSKSDDSKEDDAVTTLNRDVQDTFEKLAPADVRGNYQLVGAIWLNAPDEDFHVGVDFIEAAKQPRKQPLFGGEDRLSSTSMESFTQAGDSLPNCFACHNTESVLGLKESRLNVSHALSKFYELQRNP